MNNEFEAKCSFCGKGNSKVKAMIASAVDKSKFICDECVVKCKKELEKDKKQNNSQ